MARVYLEVLLFGYSCLFVNPRLWAEGYSTLCVCVNVTTKSVLKLNYLEIQTSYSSQTWQSQRKGGDGQVLTAKHVSQSE